MYYIINILRIPQNSIGNYKGLDIRLRFPEPSEDLESIQIPALASSRLSSSTWRIRVASKVISTLIGVVSR